MAERIDLGDGQWAVFRDVKVMTNRQRAPYLDLLFKVRHNTYDPSASQAEAWQWACATTYMLIAEWSFDHAIPNEYDLYCLALDELPAFYVDRMGLAASRLLMLDEATLDPQKPARKRAAAPAKKAARKAPVKKARKS